MMAIKVFFFFFSSSDFVILKSQATTTQWLPSIQWLLAQMFLVALELGEHPFSTQDEVLDQRILEEILKEMSNNLEETLTRNVGGREMVGDAAVEWPNVK